MCDKLVFDLSQEIEGSPNVFVRKDWINILDNQNGNYQSNQCIIDTSQLSNSNKYMSYREAYLSIPLLLGVTATGATAFGTNTTTGSMDFSLGLKNWFGSIIHSFTLDYNGTTVIQQTPFCNMWNIFKLLTTLSYGDIEAMGSSIGFYPDNPSSFSYAGLNAGVLMPSASGVGTCNNTIGVFSDVAHNLQQSSYSTANTGLLKRILNINYDAFAPLAPLNAAVATGYATLLTTDSSRLLWKNYISNKVTGTTGAGGMQISIMATVYLKHIHSFFNMIPLIKGAFMKLTMNLNNSSCKVISGASVGYLQTLSMTENPVVPVGGCNMIAVPSTASSYVGTPNTIALLGTVTAPVLYAPSGNYGMIASTTYTYDLSVGQTPLSASWSAAGFTSLQQPGTLSRSVLLYVPAYTFNPVFEQAYLSSPIKEIKYTDIYQYQVLNVIGGGQFNNLVTNGIANIKSVLMIPFFSATAGSATTGLPAGCPVYQSPFDTAGCGTTSPLCHITNFNIQISGQNAIYNMQRYGFEQFNNQLYGQNAVNGGQTDGLTSGLVDYLGFQNSYCYYYVNVERMLPVEQSVPKSVQVIGTNLSQKAVDYWIFVEYGVQVSIDLLTGARV